MAEFLGMKPYLSFFHIIGRMHHQFPVVGLEEAVSEAADQAKLHGIARGTFCDIFRKEPLIADIWETEWKSNVEKRRLAEDESGLEAQLKLAQYLCLEKLTYLYVERFTSYQIFDRRNCSVNGLPNSWYSSWQIPEFWEWCSLAGL